MVSFFKSQFLVCMTYGGQDHPVGEKFATHLKSEHMLMLFP